MPMPRPPKAPPRCHEKNGSWYWEPSARLRSEGGFRTAALGNDAKAAFAAGRALNKKADEWLAAAGPARPKKASGAPERASGLTFGDLVSRYRQSHAFAELRGTTRKTYDLCLSTLEAEFAHERAALLGKARILAWAEPLLKKSPQGLRHYLAVARRLYGWAKDRDLVTIAGNPFHELPLKIAIGKRSKRVLEADLKLLVAEADMGVREHQSGIYYAQRPDIGTIMVIAFFGVQRLSDVLRLTTENLHAGGLRLSLKQSKTGRDLDFALPQPIAARLRAYPPRPKMEGANEPPLLSGLYAADPDQAARDAFAHILARLIRKAKEKPKQYPGLAARLAGLQLRDMRRSGFCFYAAKPGITVHQICSISGHTIEEGMEILETYLPKTAEQADMAIKLAGAEW